MEETREFYSMFVDIKIINNSSNPKPEYATSMASGFDFRANLNESIILKPMDRALIPTGLQFELPVNHELQVRPRSGLALKNGVTVLNTPGTVDGDYRGEVGIILINLGKEDFVINHGDRIAQGVIAVSAGPTLYRFVESEELSETDRAGDGFGSTGVK